MYQGVVKWILASGLIHFFSLIMVILWIFFFFSYSLSGFIALPGSETIKTLWRHVLLFLWEGAGAITRCLVHPQKGRMLRMGGVWAILVWLPSPLSSHCVWMGTWVNTYMYYRLLSLYSVDKPVGKNTGERTVGTVNDFLFYFLLLWKQWFAACFASCYLLHDALKCSVPVTYFKLWWPIKNKIAYYIKKIKIWCLKNQDYKSSSFVICHYWQTAY